MRKNYFAKKFVAYSMAFAVAFSTLTVSPVFVKEAKAAVTIATVAAEKENVTVQDGIGFISKVTSSNTATSSIDLNEVAAKAGMTDKLFDVISNEADTSFNNGDANVTGTFKNLTLKGAAKDNSSKIGLVDGGEADAVGTIPTTPEEVVLNDKDFGTAKLSFNATTTKKATWYKLSLVEGSYNKTTATGTETINYSYYVVKQTNYVDQNAMDLGMVDENELGLYLAVGTDVVTDGYKLFNVHESTTLKADVERNLGYTAKEGEPCKIVVNATSNKANLKYEWVFGTKVLDETSNVLTINNVDNQSTGFYSCKVSDGVMSKKIANIQVSLATYGDIPQIQYKSVSRCVNPVNSEPTDNKLADGSVSLTACTPQNKDYVFVWFDGVAGDETDRIERSESDTLTYDASKNTVTITDKTNTYNGAQITCYVVSKQYYEDAFENYLKAIREATTDVAKYKAIDDLLDAEANDATLRTDAISCETFYLKATNDTQFSSENIVKSLGDSVTMTSPNVNIGSNDSIEYVNGKEVVVSGLYATEFGSHQFDVKTDSSNPGTADANFTQVTGTPAFSDTVKYYKKNSANNYSIDSTVTAKNFTSKISSGIYEKNRTVVATKFVNVVYTPDLEVSSNDVVAKIGQKVTLNVTGSSKLPLKYTWNGSNMASSSDIPTAGSIADPSKTNEITVKAGDIYQPKIDVNNDGIITPGDGDQAEDNYVECKVENGIETKVVKIKITQEGGFSYVGDDGVTYPSTTATHTAFIVNGIANKEVTLAPVVKANEGTELTYKWYKGASTGTVISTDASLTTKYTNGNTFTVVIADKLAENNKVELTYTVNDIALTSKNIAIDKIDAQVYTGKAIEPAIRVIAVDNTGKPFVGQLVKDTDYNVTFENNVNAGIARVIVTLSKDLDATQTAKAEATFPIDRAENKLTVADKTIVVGGSVQPKTTSVGDAPITYTYYTDAACTKEIPVPTKVGVYYVKATAIATVNYNEATSNVAKVVVAPDKPKIGNTSRTASSVTLNWAKTTGATAYRVYVKKNGKFTKVANTTGLKYTVTGLASATTYEFAVKAFVNGVASPVYSVRTTTTAPAKVATPAVKAGSKKATVTFKKVTRATGYQVYMAKGNGKYVKVATTKNLSVTKTGLTKGATYKFKVRAYKTVGSNTYYGAFSSAKAVKVK